MRVRNWVLLALVAIAVVASATLGFLSHAPNRIVPGMPMPLTAVAPVPLILTLAATAAGLAACSLLPQRPMILSAIGIGLTTALLALLFAAGSGATMLAVTAVPAARTALGPAFWISLAAILCAMIDLIQQARLSSFWRAALAAVGVASFLALLVSGLFDNLSLTREYVARIDTFAAELRRHILIVFLSVAASGLIGLPLGVAAFRRPQLGDRLFGVLGIVQTVPSIALFGLLIGPLSALSAALPALRQIGVSGIGITPALIALVLYSLLPLVRNTVAGLRAVPDAVLDAARGNGMRDNQILMQITLPLAFPVILSGFRVIVIQTIGLTVVAALIGAGGLGAFVFQGLGQNAIDLVLLGVIPTIVLALVADTAFSLISTGVREAR